MECQWKSNRCNQVFLLTECYKLHPVYKNMTTAGDMQGLYILTVHSIPLLLTPRFLPCPCRHFLQRKSSLILKVTEKKMQNILYVFEGFTILHDHENKVVRTLTYSGFSLFASQEMP